VNQLQHKNGGKWAVAGLDFVLEQDRVYYEVQLGPDFKGTVRVGVYRHEKKGISKLAKGENWTRSLSDVLNNHCHYSHSLSKHVLRFDSLVAAVNDEKGEINMKSLGVYGCTFQGLHPNAVIGVTVGFSDIPVVVYRVNGEVVSQHVSKVRGNVSPFVAWEGGGIGVAFEEKGWKGQCSRGADGVIRASNLI